MRQVECFLARNRRGAAIVGSLAPVALLLSACASKPLNVAYDPANFGPPDPVEVVKAPETIGPGDKLRVTVFQEESLSGDFQVEDHGQIDYPLIGLVEAQGRTPSELAKDITDRLRQKALRNPDVQVAVVERAQSTITVEGAVKQPGVVPIAGPTTLIQAVALARGTDENADPSKVVVFRKVNGQRMAAAFDLRAIRRAEADDPTIYPNDVVVVSAGNNSKVFEKVLQAIPILGLFRPF